jgi:transposase
LRAERPIAFTLIADWLIFSAHSGYSDVNWPRENGGQFLQGGQMSKLPSRAHCQDFRREVAERIVSGEEISALSAELGIGRQLLYSWRVAAHRGDEPRPPRLSPRPRSAPVSSSKNGEQMSKLPPRTYSRDFKRQVVNRIISGEEIRALSAELGIGRQLLYRWREAALRGAELRPRGRPLKAESAPASPSGNLDAAHRRIAELERKVGQQSMEIDYFRGALQHIEASRQAKGKSGVTASSSRARR